MDEKGPQWEPEVLIIPLHSTTETPEPPASGEAKSPQAQALEKNELLLDSVRSKRTTSLTNGETVSSIKQLQSLFEREKSPQHIPVALNKKTPTSLPNGEHASSMKQLQSLFEKEQAPQPVPLTSGKKTPPSSVKVEHPIMLKEDGKPVHPPALVASGTKTNTSPLKAEPIVILIENKEAVLPAVSVTSSRKPPTTPLEASTTLKEGGEAILPTPVTSGTKNLTSPQKVEPSIIIVEKKDSILLSTPITSDNKTTTSPLQAEPSIVLIENKETLLQPTPATKSTSSPLPVEHTNTIKQLQSLFKREGIARPEHFTSQNMPPASPKHEEVAASAEYEGEHIHQPASAMSNDRTSLPLVNGEPGGFLKDPISPSGSPMLMDQPLSLLANQELILELKKGKALRPTHQTRGLTTVFTGNSKWNRRISLDRAEATGDSPEGVGPMPHSPSSSDTSSQSRPPLNRYKST
ncbi:uncharacterized protein [Pleurodeles waltl]